MKKLYVWAFGLLLVVYVVLAFVLPADPQVLQKYNLTHLKVQVLNLTVLVPICFIYLIALRGFINVDAYAASIQGSKEGRHFKQIAWGLMVLAFSLPITSIIGVVSAYVRVRYPHLAPGVTIVRDYISLLFLMVAILWIAHGARGLYATLRRRRNVGLGPSVYAYLGPVVLTSLYTGLVMVPTTAPPSTSVDYLPMWLSITTVAIPYAFLWCVGIQAALWLSRYRRGVRGVIYRLALNNLAKGVVTIIALSMFIRLLISVSGPLNRLNLTPLLGVLYLLIVFIAVGFVLVARGAKMLKQIEEA